MGRLGYEPVTCPPTPALERLFYPDASKIAATAYRLVNEKGPAWSPPFGAAPEIVTFRGPF